MDVSEEILAENAGKPVVYLVRADFLYLFDENGYDITSFYDSYFVIVEK